MKLVITGGGTGGHVFAGVAIAQEFQRQKKTNEVLFIGSSIGLETKLVPKAGYPLKTVTLGKLVGQGVAAKLTTLAQIPVAIFKCWTWLREYRPDMVVGVGGFAAGPCILAAKALRIPIGVLEQNSVMGFTNRISAKLADFVFTAFDEIPNGVTNTKCVYTGNPSRTALAPAPLKAEQPFAVFVFGGSQGANGINKLMTEAAQELLPLKNQIKIVHQTGPKDYQWVQKTYEELGFPAEIHVFIDDMQAQYAAANLVVCRAGSSTISELAATKNAAVFVPLPTAAQNHQEHNARAVEAAGGGLVLTQTQSRGSDLANVIRELMNDPSRLAGMRDAISRFHRPDAARKIVDVMTKCTNV